MEHAPAIELTYTVTREEYGAATRRIAGERIERFTWIVVAISIPAAIAGYATGIVLLPSALLALAALVSGVVSWQRYLLPRRMWERMGFSEGAMRCRMDDEGVSFDCPGVQTHQEWKRILKARITGPWLLLYQHSRVASVVRLPEDPAVRTSVEDLLVHAGVNVAH